MSSHSRNSGRLRLAAGLAGMAALIAAGGAAAGPLAPGASIATTGTTLLEQPHLEGTIAIPGLVQSFSLTTPTGVVTGSLSEEVIHSVDNSYDFYWSVTNDASSLGRIDSLTLQNFMQDPSSLLVADFRLDSRGTVGSSFASRSPGDGNKIVFSFAGGLAPGETTHWLMLDSKALAFDSVGRATLTGLDGGLSASFGAVMPAVPEAPTSLLLGLGLAGIAMRARQRAHSI